MRNNQLHPITHRHVDDPHDNWQSVGEFIRAERERVQRIIDQREADLREFCEAEDREFANNYARRWR